MGLFDWLFPKKQQPREKDFEGFFKVLNGYTPHFTSWSGGVYESELVRSAINARSTHISKLKVEINGAARQKLQTKLRHAPNEFQTWGQFLYRLNTILDIHNTAFIVPVYDNFGEVSGVYAPLPERVEFVQFNNVPYLRYEFSWGQKAAIELSNCGIMTKFQYRDDFLGETNSALLPTMNLIKMQNQGIEEGVKSSASYRFMAQLSNFAKAEDLAEERKRFTIKNLASDGGGMLLFPSTYSNIQQIKSTPFVADPEQMKMIRDNVYTYFGVNEDILNNKAFGDAWYAFYEGAIEPFAVQFSEVMTRMLFTPRERSQGANVTATSNRLLYMGSKEKLNISVQMVDRGILSLNEIREIWNLPPIDGGDIRVIRGEYYNAEEKVSEDCEEGEENEEGNQSV